MVLAAATGEATKVPRVACPALGEVLGVQRMHVGSGTAVGALAMCWEGVGAEPAAPGIWVELEAVGFGHWLSVLQEPLSRTGTRVVLGVLGFKAKQVAIQKCCLVHSAAAAVRWSRCRFWHLVQPAVGFTFNAVIQQHLPERLCVCNLGLY